MATLRGFALLTQVTGSESRSGARRTVLDAVRVEITGFDAEAHTLTVRVLRAGRVPEGARFEIPARHFYPGDDPAARRAFAAEVRRLWP